MISDITGIDYELLEDNLTLEANELPVDKNMIINFVNVKVKT